VLFLYAGMAHAVRYAGSCVFDFEGKPIGGNVQEKKSGHSIFLWVYSSAWPHNTQMRTSIGDTNLFSIMADSYDLDFLVSGPIIATLHAPIYTIRREDEPKKTATFEINYGGGHVVIIHGDDCKHWVCTDDNDPKCADPHGDWR